MNTKKSHLLIFCLFLTLGSSLFAFQETNSVVSMYEERSKLFDLIFPEEKATRPILRGLELLQKDKMPMHVCINMEGNRRWAREHEISISDVYKKSVKNAIKILKLEVSLGIKTITIPCFSLYNALNRPPEETQGLLQLLSDYLSEDINFIKPFVCIKTVGDLSTLPLDLQESLEMLKKETASSKGLTLVLAINYEGRDEITRSVIKIAKNIEAGIICSNDISTHLIESYLDSAGIPNADLYIQTGNDHTTFPVWKQFYTEFFTLPMLWPDFQEQDFIDVLLEYQMQERKFGF